MLIARAQKETVLEEKDKLTILNQAVIIFDTDGDGLSDDLEEYVPVALIDDQGFKVEKIREIKSGELGEPLYGQLIADESLPTRTLYYVTGQRIEQISRMTNTKYEGGIHRVYDVMKKMNITLK